MAPALTKTLSDPAVHAQDVKKAAEPSAKRVDYVDLTEIDDQNERALD